MLDRPEYRIEKIVFQSRPGLYVTGNFYLPKKAAPPLPTILYVCGHSPHPLGAKGAYQDRAFWFAEQLYFGSRSYGNVGYFAHIGGFAAGAAVAWVLQLAAVIRRGRRAPPLEPRDSASLVAPRRPFREISGGADPAFLDDSVDTFAVVTLEDAAARAARISEVAGAGSRIGATHGVVVRSVSRAEADRIRRDLKSEGIASALVADVPPNHPPAPQRTEREGGRGERGSGSRGGRGPPTSRRRLRLRPTTAEAPTGARGTWRPGRPRG